MNQPDWIKVAEVVLTYKSKVKPSERPKIISSQDLYKIFLQYWDLGKIEMVEQFKIILLNASHKVLGICEISSGSVGGCVADPRQIFSAAIKGNAVKIALCHNHPSGSLKPSKADESLTEKLRIGGRFLEIAVMEHIIISTEGYFSFADEGML